MKEKLYFVLTVTAITLVMSFIGNISFELLANNHIPQFLKSLSSYLYIFLIPITMFITIGFGIFTKFLEKNKPSKDDDVSKRVQKLEAGVRELTETRLASTIQISKEEKNDLIQRLNNQFENNITQEYIVNLENKFKLRNLEEATDLSISRIEKEIRYLRSTGNIQLYIGVLLSITAIALVAEKVFLAQLLTQILTNY